MRAELLAAVHIFVSDFQAEKMTEARLLRGARCPSDTLRRIRHGRDINTGAYDKLVSWMRAYRKARQEAAAKQNQAQPGQTSEETQQ